jgi:4-hydroxy-3-methylbut-2-enyl diphosphate reductase
MLIADKHAIDWDRTDKASHIGLSAGASAPESLVQDVIQTLAERYDLQVTEHGHIRETVNFKLPPILTQ